MLKKILLIAEFLVLFISFPLVVYTEWFFIPRIPALIVVSIYSLFILLRDKTFRSKKLINLDFNKRQLRTVMIRAAAVFFVLTILTWYIKPELLFTFVKQRPIIWLVVMCLYPFFSAYPQEILYRAFMFHRYKYLFAKSAVMILVSTATFSFLHIIYDNSPAIVLTLLGGYLFSKTYDKSKSLTLVSIEHALYGMIVFTTGLGTYFYEGFR
ncbi:CPBP family intramembrane metalloprotease [candidate division KSB1 bacterium]|nr:CPBP family intramembrane metalloprotease [candidate division KSB1 bacterium]